MGETLNQTPRWRFEMIEHLRPATIFDWGTTDDFMWAAYRTPSGWMAKRSIDDGENWNVKRVATSGQKLDAGTAVYLLRCEQEMLGDFSGN